MNAVLHIPSLSIRFPKAYTVRSLCLTVPHNSFIKFSSKNNNHVTIPGGNQYILVKTIKYDD